MSYRESTRRISFDADASIAQYTGISGMPGAAAPNYGPMYSLVKLTGSHTIGLCTGAANEICDGILANKPQKLGTGASMSMRKAGGVENLIAGAGGVAAGNAVKSDANGHGVVAALPADVALVVGKAVEAAAAGAAFPLLFV